LLDGTIREEELTLTKKLMLTTILLALLVAFAAASTFFQRLFIYYPRRYPKGAMQRALSQGILVINFRTSQGKHAAFFYRGSALDSHPSRLWIMFGGNAMLALDWLDFLRKFPDALAGFLLVDYPGYGNCEGRSNPVRILETSENALHAMLAQTHWTFGPESIGILWWSLGAAAALQFAAKYPAGQLILVSPFTTMNDMVKKFIGFNPGPFVLHRFDNVQALRRILAGKPRPKVTIVHGRADTLVPTSMGRALAQLDPGKIRFVEIPDADHNDVFSAAQALVFADMVTPG
jgi:uncharacterized protein